MRWIASILLVIGFAGAACGQSGYAAKVTVKSGNSFVVKKLEIKGDRLLTGTGQSSASLQMVKSIEFRFAGIGLPLCEKMFNTGDRKALAGLLEQYVSPVAQYSYLPTNLGGYLEWLLRAQYWNGNTAGAGRTIGHLRKTGAQEQIDFASFYFTLLLLDQGKTDDAEKVFSSIGNPETISEAGAEFIRGKFALEKGDPRQAMQHVARIIAFHSRDPEWMTPATVLEARIYQKLGHQAKAAVVADELVLAYPGTQWSRLGEEIQKESKRTAGE